MDRVITSLSEAPVIKTPAFGELISAIRERVTVSFDYVRDSDSLRSQRNVEPERLLLRDQEWILQGWDLDRNVPRFFIVENIVGEVTLGEKYVPRDEAPLLKDGTVDEGRHEIEVLAPSDLEALLISEGGVVMANHDSSVRLLFRTFNQERLLRILISLNPTIEVTSPPDSAKAWVVLRKQLHDAI
jgi:predicted DNA-binding transcriptional regulator YafY